MAKVPDEEVPSTVQIRRCRETAHQRAWKTDSCESRIQYAIVLIGLLQEPHGEWLCSPLTSIEDTFEAVSIHIADTYPKLLAVVYYFENSYLGQSPRSLTQIVQPCVRFLKFNSNLK